MSVYNLLTDQDKELITEYIKTYASLGDKVVIPQLPQVLNLWDINKSKTLQQLFGGKDLILKKDYNYKFTEEELLEYYHEVFTKDDAANVLAAIKEKTLNFLKSKTFNKDEQRIIEQLFTEKNIINNSYLGSIIIIHFSDGTKYKITPGTKLLRIIRHFVKKDEKEDYAALLEKFTIWCSQVRNQNTIEGELCLSIHPLDYLTLSDNGSGWTSCINWDEPGESRTGSMECLNSPMLIVAYLNNKKQPFEFAKNYFWNNKQWRELFIFNQGIISEIKGYPYQNRNLTETILSWLKELAEKNLGYTFPEKINLSIGEFQYKQAIYHIIPECNHFMYNDFGSLQQHTGFVNYLDFINLDNEYFIDDKEVVHYFTHLEYAAPATCAGCGELLPHERLYNEKVLCSKCEPGFRCSYCNSWIYDESKKFHANEFSPTEPICENCYQNFTFIDDLTQEICMTDRMIKLYWADEENYLSHEFITIQDPGFYLDNELYWQIFSDYPKLYWNDEYYITQDKIKNFSKFMEVFGLEENPFI